MQNIVQEGSYLNKPCFHALEEMKGGIEGNPAEDQRDIKVCVI